MIATACRRTAHGTLRVRRGDGFTRRAVLVQALGVLVAHAFLAPWVEAAGPRNPAPRARAAAPRARHRWQIFSDANEVHGIAVRGARLYAATGGGVVAWDIPTGKLLRKWTTLDGLLGTRAYAVTICPLPRPQLVVGMMGGLNLYDLETQRWESMTPYNSGLTAGNVTALASDPRRQILYVGHGYAGLDIFDAKSRSWRHLATVNGLPSNKVEAVAVTADGDQVWVICPVGAARLEGPNLKAWTMTDIGVRTELTSAIATDAAGRVWLIARNGSLLRFAGGSWKVYGAAPLGGAALHPEAGIAATADGAVWFTTVRGELRRFDPATETSVPRSRAPSLLGWNGLQPGPAGSLLAATDAGVKMLPAASPTARSFVVAGDVLRGNHVVALAEDRAGTIWIATNGGTYTVGAGDRPTALRPLAQPVDKFGPGRIGALYADPRGGMWFGTTAGAAYFDGSTWRRLTRADGLVGDTVRAIVRDGRGRMWFGTNRGISVWDGTSARSITAREGLRSEDVHSLFARRDVVWAGTREFMFRFEGDRLEFLDDEVMGVEFEVMRMIAAYTSDSLVLGTSNGLAFIDGRTGRDDTEIYGDAVSGLAVGTDGDLWVGTESRGLFHREGHGWVNLTTDQGLPANGISALLLDRRGALWIGTSEAGLARYGP